VCARCRGRARPRSRSLAAAFALALGRDPRGHPRAFIARGGTPRWGAPPTPCDLEAIVFPDVFPNPRDSQFCMWYIRRMQEKGQLVTIAVRVEPALHALIKRAAHRREKSLATYVRERLREAAEYDAREA
jgi:HicB family